MHLIMKVYKNLRTIPRINLRKLFGNRGNYNYLIFLIFTGLLFHIKQKVPLSNHYSLLAERLVRSQIQVHQYLALQL